MTHDLDPETPIRLQKFHSRFLPIETVDALRAELALEERRHQFALGWSQYQIVTGARCLPAYLTNQNCDFTWFDHWIMENLFVMDIWCIGTQGFRTQWLGWWTMRKNNIYPCSDRRPAAWLVNCWLRWGGHLKILIDEWCGRKKKSFVVHASGLEIIV